MKMNSKIQNLVKKSVETLQRNLTNVNVNQKGASFARQKGTTYKKKFRAFFPPV